MAQQRVGHDWATELNWTEWLISQESTAVQEPQETQVQSVGREDPLEEGMATHSSILAWRIPWTKDLVGYSP